MVLIANLVFVGISMAIDCKNSGTSEKHRITKLEWPITPLGQTMIKCCPRGLAMIVQNMQQLMLGL